MKMEYRVSTPIAVPRRPSFEMSNGHASDDPLGSSPPCDWAIRLHRRLSGHAELSTISLSDNSFTDRYLAAASASSVDTDGVDRRVSKSLA